MLKFPPDTDSELERAIGVTGRDEVLFIRGVNILDKDQDLAIVGFSWGPLGATLVVFSPSELEFLYLKLSLGRSCFIADLPLNGEGLGDGLSLVLIDGLGVRRKLTLLGVGVGVGGIFI